ncbi:MAG: hypothetical protein K2N48_07900 [Muribaculaceae bacterium]|nr:hypothetical protein [Muribaculaceae bacterium]
MKKILLTLGIVFMALPAMSSPRSVSMENIITSAEGEKVDVTMTTSGLTMSGIGLVEYNDKMYASHLVYGDNDEVYIYEIFSGLPTKSYVKGVKDGDKILIDLPQPIFYEFDPDLGFPEAYYMSILTMRDDWYWPEEKSTLTLSIDAAGNMKAEGLSRDVILGVADNDDDTWIGLGAWDLTISTTREDPVTLPDGYEVTENFWTSVGNEYGWQVNFAQGGEEVYFQGLSERLPEAWVKGTVDYDDTTATVTIAQDQYVGEYMGYPIFTKCVRTSVDDKGNVFLEDFMPSDYAFKLVWDFEEETMTAEDRNVLLVFNVSKGEISLLNDLMDMKLIRQDSFEGTPEAPYALKFEDAMQEEGFSLFTFTLPAVSTEGDYLSLGDLGYVVYVDGEPWTFDAEDYEIEESLEEIPWTFDKYWICKGYQSPVHTVAFFVEGITTLGVQTVYRYGGIETRSEIVTINVDELEYVEGLDAGDQVDKVTYYDLSGREISSPVNGIFLKVSRMSDGSIRTSKEAR